MGRRGICFVVDHTRDESRGEVRSEKRLTGAFLRWGNPNAEQWLPPAPMVDSPSARRFFGKWTNQKKNIQTARTQAQHRSYDTDMHMARNASWGPMSTQGLVCLEGQASSTPPRHIIPQYRQRISNGTARGPRATTGTRRIKMRTQSTRRGVVVRNK